MRCRGVGIWHSGMEQGMRTVQIRDKCRSERSLAWKLIKGCNSMAYAARGEGFGVQGCPLLLKIGWSCLQPAANMHGCASAALCRFR